MSMIDQINKHRSIRHYSSNPIPEEKIKKILSAGIRASSSGNMQSYSIILTREKDRRQQLSQALGGQEMVLEAPAFLTFCSDFHRMRKWLAIRDAKDNFDNFLAFMIGAIDAILVSQNVTIAAESQGLGICYLGGTLVFCDQVGTILHLPKNVVPVVGLCMGFPDENPELHHRLPYEGLVHKETYQDYSRDDIIQIYEEKEKIDWERYLKSPRMRELVEGEHIKNLAQLYTNLKYTKDFHQDYSRKILTYLENKGFMNHGG